jgi:hypothetical protein
VVAPSQEPLETALRAEVALALTTLARLPLVPPGPVSWLAEVTMICTAAFAHSVSVTVLLGSPAAPDAVASDSALAQTGDGAQLMAGQGPTFDAHRHQRTVCSDDLSRDRRWPLLGNRLASTWRWGAVAAPVRALGAQPGVLTAYVPPAAMGGGSARVVELLAGTAGAVIAHLALRGRMDNLTHDFHAALQSRGTIEQAKGVLMAQEGCDPDQAFAILVARSNRENIKVRDLAARIVDQVQSARAGDSRRPR